MHSYDILFIIYFDRMTHTHLYIIHVKSGTVIIHIIKKRYFLYVVYKKSTI